MLRNITLHNCIPPYPTYEHTHNIKREKKKEKCITDAWGDGLGNIFSEIFIRKTNES
jgi:hypothetical protein